MKNSKFVPVFIICFFFVFAGAILAQIQPQFPPPLINYQGFLNDSKDGSPISGDLSMIFSIYSTQQGTAPVWTETQTVKVDSGHFSILLGAVQPISYQLFLSNDLFLGVKVGNDEEMTPRKPLVSVGYSFSSVFAQLAFDSGKLGGRNSDEYLARVTEDDTSGTIVSLLNNGSGRALEAKNRGTGGAVYFAVDDFANGSDALEVVNYGTGRAGFFKINNVPSNITNHMPAIEVSTNGDGPGVYTTSTDGFGILSESENDYAGIFKGANGIEVSTNGSSGYSAFLYNSVRISWGGWHGLQIDSTNWAGVYVGASGYDGFEIGNAGRFGLHIHKAKQDGIRILSDVGRDYIRAGSDADLDFRVTNNGMAYADGGWQGAADFAELIETDETFSSYEPGDVLVISPNKNRTVVLSTKPYSTNVIGVYSTKPGFVGSTHPMEDKYHNEIPVAITGIVPCKVTAENGPIQRGDLLTTSKIPGFAMKATDHKNGSILGKALEPLKSGKSKIEILVVLQ